MENITSTINVSWYTSSTVGPVRFVRVPLLFAEKTKTLFRVLPCLSRQKTSRAFGRGLFVPDGLDWIGLDTGIIDPEPRQCLQQVCPFFAPHHGHAVNQITMCRRPCRYAIHA